MELTILQSCPSCGAEIELNEDDRLVTCAFCDVHNYRIDTVGCRYLLPYSLPDDVSSENLYFVPYLRFKGVIYYVQNKEVKHKIVDTTRLGVEDDKLPVSLGLRPQVLKVKPVVSADKGRFVLQTVPTKSLFVQAAKIVDLFQTDEKIITYHRAFIGETLSRIYQPYYIKDDIVFDGVDGRKVGPKKLLEDYLDKTCSAKPSWEPQFLSTHCKTCGGLMTGERDSIVLSCTNCESLWQQNRRSFDPLGWKVVSSTSEDSIFLPFWKINFSTTGKKLRSFGDYLRFTNQPVADPSRFDRQQLSFWVPAFKVNPKTLLQLSSKLTLGQKKIPDGETRRILRGHPVTLQVKEAVEAIKSILAATTTLRSKRYPQLIDMNIETESTTLTYLPFTSQVHDLVQEHTTAAIQTAALRYGRAL